jgi:hypothetical protein
MQFVYVDEDGQYVVDPAAKKCLEHQKTLSVISVIGRYRTGKSSLMNAILEAPGTFSTSSTVQAHTKGIHLYPVPGGHTMLLDTEGLGSLGASTNHDAAIFALSTILSTTCMINTMGSISLTELEDLRLATKIAALVMDHSDLGAHIHRPDLTWVLRDFVLELVSSDGTPLTPLAYLDQCLLEYADLRTLFPVRTCIPLPRPAVLETDVRTMSNTRPEFLVALNHVRDQVLRPAVHPTTGIRMVALAEAFCVALNKNLVPDLQSVWDMVCARSKEQATARGKEVFMSCSDLGQGLEEALDTWHQDWIGLPSGEEVKEFVLFLMRSGEREHPSLSRTHDLETQLILLATKSAQCEKDLQSRLDEVVMNATESEERLRSMVVESFQWQQRAEDYKDQLDQSTLRQEEVTADIMKMVETVRVQNTAEKLELNGLHQKLLDANTGRSGLQRQVDDMTRDNQRDRLLGERREQRSRELHEDVTDLRNKLQKAIIDVEVWRTRFDDAELRSNKRQRLSDTSSTEQMVQRAEIEYLRTRTKESEEQIRGYRRDLTALTHELQTTKVKLALHE